MKLVDILKEGYFHLPQKVYQGIINAYYDAYEKFRVGDIKRVTDKNFPDQTFDIDFSGTRYEFLNSLEPKPKIILSFTAQKNRSFFNSEKIQYNIGLITIDLMQGRRAVYDVIEHEMLHFVQYLVKNYRRNLLYKKLKDAETNKDYKEIIRLRAAIAQTGIGGLPAKKYVAADVSTQGYAKGGSGARRVQHSRRPIEYYPDLLSSIRELHKEYHERHGSDANWEKLKNSESEKKKFFVEFMNDVSAGSTKGIARWVFQSFKELGPEFFRKMLAIAYDAFVNKDPNFDAAEVKRKFNSVAEKIMTSEFFDGPVKVPAKDFEYASWRSFYKGISLNTDDPETMKSFVKIFQDIGVKIGGRGNLTLPENEEDIREVFKKLAEKKKNGDVSGLQMTRPGDKYGNAPADIIKPEDMFKEITDSFYDNLFHQLRWWYSKHVRKEQYSTFIKFVNVSYGLPANAI